MQKVNCKMQNEDPEYRRDFTKQIQTKGVSMKKFLASALMIAFVGGAFAMEGHENHKAGMSCGMGEKSMCSAKDFSVKQMAGPYTVGIHAMGKSTMLCILDSTGKPVTVKGLTVSQAEKGVKATAGSCGYTLAKDLDLSKGELKVSFKVGAKSFQTSLSPSSSSATTPVNTLCPVMGGKVDPKYTVTHEGKVIAFCCPGCIPEFKKDPAKFMGKLK